MVLNTRACRGETFRRAFGQKMSLPHHPVGSRVCSDILSQKFTRLLNASEVAKHSPRIISLTKAGCPLRRLRSLSADDKSPSWPGLEEIQIWSAAAEVDDVDALRMLLADGVAQHPQPVFLELGFLTRLDYAGLSET